MRVGILALFVLALLGCGKERLLEQYTYEYEGYRYECMRDFATKIGPVYCWARYKPKTTLRQVCKDTMPWDFDYKLSEDLCQF